MSIDISVLIDSSSTRERMSLEHELRKKIWDEYDRDLIHNWHRPRSKRSWPKSIGKE